MTNFDKDEMDTCIEGLDEIEVDVCGMFTNK